MAEQQAEAHESLQRKRQLFDGLNESTNSDDDVPDPGRESSVRAMKKGAARKHTVAASKGETSNGLPRSLSDTNLTMTRGQPATTSGGEALRPVTSNANSNLPLSLMTRHTTPGAPSTSNQPTTNVVPSSSKPPKTTAKRKRENSANQVPIEQQIFKGLNFYFFPNTETHPARKMRIAKAVEFGAIWQKDFNDGVSHVIVDKAMDYSLLLKFLKRDKLPADVTVVSENYPAECISYRTTLDPRQLQFKVKGYNLALGSRPNSSGTDRSLQLKAAGRTVKTRQPETSIPDKRALSPRPILSDNEDEGGNEPPSLGVASRKSSTSEIASTEEFDLAVQKAR